MHALSALVAQASRWRHQPLCALTERGSFVHSPKGAAIRVLAAVAHLAVGAGRRRHDGVVVLQEEGTTTGQHLRSSQRARRPRTSFFPSLTVRRMNWGGLTPPGAFKEGHMHWFRVEQSHSYHAGVPAVVRAAGGTAGGGGALGGDGGAGRAASTRRLSLGTLT